MVVKANRDFELELLEKYNIVAGVDEVGRGCLAGPVYVCIAVVDKNTKDCEVELRDSKLLSEKARQEKLPFAKKWLVDYAVGICTNEEIDNFGITKALQIAGQKAISELENRGIKPDVYILDGKHDWLGMESDLFTQNENEKINVVTKVKADANCSVVASASIIAKVLRDEYMCSLNDDKYDFSNNKGYGAKKHIEGLKKYGVSALHRKTWKMPI